MSTLVRFLRRRQGQVEAVTANMRWTPAEKARALAVLRGCVVLVAHPYERHPSSGAGNCWCGRWANHRLHAVILDVSDGIPAEATPPGPPQPPRPSGWNPVA